MKEWTVQLDEKSAKSRAEVALALATWRVMSYKYDSPLSAGLVRLKPVSDNC